MSQREIIIQSAPEYDGDAGQYSAVVWTGGSVVRVHGVYTGRKNLNSSIAFVAIQSGTVGSGTIELTWNGLGQTGVISVGSGYTAANVIHVVDGIGVSFSAGSVVAGNVFQIIGIDSRRIVGRAYRALVGSEQPDLWAESFSFVDDDVPRFTHDRRLRRVRLKRRKKVSIEAQWLDRIMVTAVDDMEQGRQLVTVNENYGKDTVLLFRPGPSVEPMIGQHFNFLRTGVAAVQDSETHLWRLDAPTNGPRLIPGPELQSQSAPAQNRHAIPSVYAHVGRGMTVLAVSRSNLLPKSHPKNGDLNIATWKGAPAIAWNPDRRGVLMPGAGWPALMTDGVADVWLKDLAADGARLGTSYATVTAGVYYSAHIWVLIWGNVRFSILTGVSTPGTILTSNSYTDGTAGQWVLVTLAGTIPATHTVASIGIDGIPGLTGDSRVLVSHSQIEAGIGVSPPILSDGAPGTVNNENARALGKLPPEGTLSFWFRAPVEDAATTYTLVDSQTGGRFEVLRDSAANQWQFYVKATAPLLATTTVLSAGSWRHLAFRWSMVNVASATQLKIDILENGVQVGTANVSDPFQDWGELLFMGGPNYAAGCGFFDIRIDRRPLTDAEVFRSYNLIAIDDARHAFIHSAGRFFDFESNEGRDLFRGAPGRQIHKLGLIEADYHDDALLRPR